MWNDKLEFHVIARTSTKVNDKWQLWAKMTVATRHFISFFFFSFFLFSSFEMCIVQFNIYSIHLFDVTGNYSIFLFIYLKILISHVRRTNTRWTICAICVIFKLLAKKKTPEHEFLAFNPCPTCII